MSKFGAESGVSRFCLMMSNAWRWYINFMSGFAILWRFIVGPGLLSDHQL
jgi:hypothetical protein